MAPAIKALLAACWFMALVFPVMGIRLNLVENRVEWMFGRVAWLGISIFFLALLWNWYFSRKKQGLSFFSLPGDYHKSWNRILATPHLRSLFLCVILIILLAMPLVGSFYQTNIMISAMLYIMLALGLNIVVGLAGQLVLGYVSFYAIGAYTYGLLHQFFGLGFWLCLPLGGILSGLAGLALGFPVLRLRGDYLAIVTLGFGEIVRLGLLNWTSLTGGPRGVSDIPPPGFFEINLNLQQTTLYIYYLTLAAVFATVIVIYRLKNSRIGLALQAMREDEIASEAMGINITRAKLAAFALGSCWAGFAGVLFAAKTTFINPSSFTFMESAMILSMVVLGGMGSIGGVIIAAIILILAPEYLRAFSEYRMLIFGAIMVVMMIFRPQGLVSGKSRNYHVSALHGAKGGSS